MCGCVWSHSRRTHQIDHLSARLSGGCCSLRECCSACNTGTGLYVCVCLACALLFSSLLTLCNACNFVSNQMLFTIVEETEQTIQQQDQQEFQDELLPNRLQMHRIV